MSKRYAISKKILIVFIFNRLGHIASKMGLAENYIFVDNHVQGIQNGNFFCE